LNPNDFHTNYADELSAPPTVRLTIAEKPTTGSKWADKQINDAVEMALLRLQPIIRDTLRAEIKRVLQIEEIV
jgi:hypothetical protein